MIVFMVILVGPAQCEADILHGLNEGHRNKWLTARGFHDGPGAIASTHRPNVRVQPTGRFHEPKIRDGPAVRVSNYFQRNSNKQQKTHVHRIAQAQQAVAERGFLARCHRINVSGPEDIDTRKSNLQQRPLS